MAEEYYRKTASLFEEFKKRELRLMSLEKSPNYNMTINNEPHQNYVQKINEIERRSEKTYRNLMKSVDDLDKCTEGMSFKMEKLITLRNIILNPPSTQSVSSFALENTLQMSYAKNPDSSLYLSAAPRSFPRSESPLFQNAFTSSIPASNDIFSGESSPYVPGKFFPDFKTLTDSKTESTQTDDLVCGQCLSSFASLKHGVEIGSGKVIYDSGLTKDSFSDKGIRLQQLDESMFTLSNDLQDVQSLDGNHNVETRETVSRRVIDDPGFTKDSLPNKALQLQRHDESVLTFSSDHQNDNVESLDKNLDVETHQSVYRRKIYDSSLVNDSDKGLQSKQHVQSSYKNQSDVVRSSSITHKQPDEENLHQESADQDIHSSGDMLDNTEMGDEDKITTEEDNTIASNASQDKTKSDNESMNHEFDFLESDKLNHRQLKDQPEVVVSSVSSDKAEDKTEIGSSVQLHSEVPSRPNRKGANNILPQDKTDYMDIKRNSSELLGVDAVVSDSSASADPSSPRANFQKVFSSSESDSLSEKDLPLTATAAYQALLGNASAFKSREVESDSVSEDEIENALKKVVKKTDFNALPTPVPSQKRKESLIEGKPVSQKRHSVSASISKPASRLSKNTKKILGYDTSSGSEVEVKQASSKSKGEESDEFDFYD